MAKYKKSTNGYYNARVWDGTMKDGRKHYINVRSKKSSRDLEMKVREVEERVRNQSLVTPSGLSFYEYSKNWRQMYKGRVSNATKAMYDGIIEKHFSPFEDVPLSDIGRIHLELMLDAAAEHPRTCQQIALTFKQVIRSAIADGFLPASALDAIFRDFSTVKYKPTEKRALTPDERRAVFSAPFAPMDKIFAFIIYGAGLRRGEALALLAEDIDTEGKRITVNKAVEFVGNGPALKAPKSQNGFRSVPIPDAILPELADYIATLPMENEGRLFVGQNGEYMSKTAYRRMWERILKAMGTVCDTQGLTAHVFRHNYCTNLCYMIPAVSIKTIARLMGDTEKMVLDVYNHIMSEREDVDAVVNEALKI